MGATESPLLLAAQRELENRREELARIRAAEQWPVKDGRDAKQRLLVRRESHKARQESQDSAKTAVSWQLFNAQKELMARRERLGGSVEEQRRRCGATGVAEGQGCGGVATGGAIEVAKEKGSRGDAVQGRGGEVELAVDGSVRVYPTLATAVLQAELAAAGRVYWLLRHVDEVGRGWLAVEQMREVLTKRGSALRVCGWRRLRQLLQQGEGKLWERDGRGRLWLYGPVRILERLVDEGRASAGLSNRALAKPSSRFEGRAVAVPVVKLLGGIGKVRAYLYATFHAGRVARQESAASRPITRETIWGKTAVSATTQRRYEHIAQIRVQSNVALGGRWDAVRCEQAAWERGRAVFEFVDGAGEQGVVGGRYIAWRLGNCYESSLVQLPKGRQKKLNRRLPLVIDGRGGREKGIERLYYPNGKLAARAATRRPEQDHYFPTSRAGTRHAHMDHVNMWHVVGGSP